MTFGAALEACRGGQRVARSGWNGRGMWVAYWAPGTYAASSELFENCRPARVHAESARSKSVDVAGCLVLKAADGMLVFGWLASQTDMLALDWEVV